MGKIKNKNNKNEGRKRNPIGTSVVILIPMLLLLFGSGHASGAVVQEPNRLILEKAFKIQMPFIENQGQISDDHVRFYAQTFGGALKVTESGEIIHSFLLTELQNHTKDRHSPRPSSNRVVKSWTLKEKLVGNLNPVLQGMDESKAKANYFIGNDQKKHKTDIPTYNVVSLGEVYKGIELILKAHGKNVEKIFTMKPGADPRAIKLAIEGANSLNINDKGESKSEATSVLLNLQNPWLTKKSTVNGLK